LKSKKWIRTSLLALLHFHVATFCIFKSFVNIVSNLFGSNQKKKILTALLSGIVKENDVTFWTCQYKGLLAWLGTLIII